MKKIYMITAYEDYDKTTNVLGMWTDKEQAILQAQSYAREAYENYGGYENFDVFLVEEYDLDTLYPQDWENLRLPLRIALYKVKDVRP